MQNRIILFLLMVLYLTRLPLLHDSVLRLNCERSKCFWCLSPFLFLPTGGVFGAAAERPLLPDCGGFSGAAGERVALLWPQVQPAEQLESQQPGQRLYTHIPAVPGLRAPGEVFTPHRSLLLRTVKPHHPPCYVTSLHFPSVT